MGELQVWPGDAGWPEDCLRAAEEAWDMLDNAMRFAVRAGLPTHPIIVAHRPLIEAAILGEPDPRDFNELTFDEQRASMARYRRQWAADLALDAEAIPMTDPTPDDLIAEQATEAPPPEPVPDAAELPGDVKDGVAGEPDADADDGADSHTEGEPT